MSISFYKSGYQSAFQSQYPSRGGITPPPSSGLALWLKADAGITLGSGSSVAGWADQSGNGNDVAQAAGANQPTLTASVINGLPGVLYSGSAQTLRNTTSNIVANNHARSVIAVIKSTTAAGGVVMQFRLNDDFASFGWAALLEASGGTAYAYSDSLTSSANFVTAPPINGIAYAAEWTCAGAGSPVAISLNAVDQPLANATMVPDSTGPTGFAVGNGAGTNGGNAFPGYVCELLVYDHVLSGGDLTLVRKYLEARYAIALGAP